MGPCLIGEAASRDSHQSLFSADEGAGGMPLAVVPVLSLPNEFAMHPRWGLRLQRRSGRTGREANSLERSEATEPVGGPLPSEPTVTTSAAAQTGPWMTDLHRRCKGASQTRRR